MKTIILSFFIVLLGCGAAQKVETDESAPLIDKSEHVSAPVVGESEKPVPETTPPLPPGVIQRADLQGVLSAGPAALLQKVVTEPVRKNGKFVGFRIAKFTQTPPTAIDLRPGDVVLSVNGRKIERPENYFQVFEELQVASELRFKLLRDNEVKILLYPIID
jgi:type II secretory pathway component PulC